MISVAFRESRKTLRAHPWRHLVGTVTIASILAASTLMETATLHTTLSTLEGEVDRGANVLIVESPGQPLSGAVCESMTSQPDVIAAGGVSHAEVVELGQPALVSVRKVSATTGYFLLMRLPVPTDAESAAAVGARVADELGIVDRSLIQTSFGSVRLQIAPDAIRAEERSRWMTVLRHAGWPVDQCWIEARNGTVDAVKTIVTASFHEVPEVTLAVLRDRTTTETTMRAWDARSTQWAWPAAGALSGVVCALIVAARRHEYALYRILGVRRAAVKLIAVLDVESMLFPALIFAATFVSTAGVWSFDSIQPEVIGSACEQLLVAFSIGSLVGVTAAIVVSSGGSASIVRRHR